MRVGIAWSYFGQGFDFRRLLLDSTLMGRDDTPGHNQLGFRLPGAPRGYSKKEDIWRGEFDFGPDLADISGTVTGISRFGDGKIHFIDGIELPYGDVATAMRTASKADDLAIFAKAFAGNDSIDTTILGDRLMADRLEGFGGNDTLIGGGGADRLYGGTGADRFSYKSIQDSIVSADGRDTIYDFSAKQKDRIDLRKIDANAVASGNQGFTFVGSQEFQGVSGELRYRQAKSGLVVEADVNGDAVADFSIYLKGVAELRAGYFLL